MELEVKGALVLSGKVDLKLTMIGDNKEGTKLLDLYDIDANGGQIASTTVRGKLLHHSKIESHTAFKAASK